MKTGSQILLEQLIHHGVDSVHGYPGGAIMPVYDALLDYRDKITHYRYAHEQGAVHAADGYARSTGNVGICITTSGPGATNTVTGIATAFMDSVPVVIFTGQVPTWLFGTDSFQEIDITSICEPITKKTFLVEDIDELANIVAQAINIAKSGRPGPVLVDLPKDILLSKTSYTPAKFDIEIYAEAIDINLIKEVCSLIDSAKRPLIYAGGGIKMSNSSNLLNDFAKKGEIPIANSLMGLGSFPLDNPLALGLSGMHGLAHVNQAIINCDLLIVAGARFSDRAIGNSSDFASNATIVHLDIDDTEFTKNIDCHYYLQGDLNIIFKQLIDCMNSRKNADWMDWINSKKNPYKPIEQYCPQNIIKTINQMSDDETIIITDTGQHQMWTAQNWCFKHPKGFITSGGLGTMGYGLGAAIGATIGNPDLPTLLITGDGSFRMNFSELVTVAKYQLPITIILINNESLGMVRQLQKLFNNNRFSEVDNKNEIDYIKLCGSFKIAAEKATTLEELKSALERRSHHEGAYLIEVLIDSNEDVYPIVPPGESLAGYRTE